ncbi:BTE_collapsed_G0055840.mRNA.1.CDS.1 [Saccharomyces cerevisiae]|nr:BBT_HP_G0064970.mRNA.1.CDS.1 [Saccharomyces cerevisiae]CAI5204285.1 BBT_HP_G0171280.mRNA.1.CDS.1 [Saccharomyces cerevisiae]CAI6814750.1 BBT_HP_G0064970.mRNA.1.CDS.1 [Saccharomyces cerevisiae]CAI7008910.1 BBT_HP_G0171280.mRNA.1.CDS.1 [Saccharomyces cerevisiae]CAI7385796.1 ASB_collapsed_G0055630.mRNA.1.CDS.1 [Saccharomyces cerevisiae]
MDAFENMSVSNHPGGNARRNSQSANEMLAPQIQDFQNIPRSFNDSNANVNLSKNCTVGNQLPFSSRQQKIIMEHLLITKNNSQQQKDYSHVPCKFFKMGNCQAGSSCPFSHSPDIISSANNLPCKYFAKGNCKFGNKCVNAHVLPNGFKMNSKEPIDITPPSQNNYLSHARSASFSTYTSPPLSAQTEFSHSASNANYFSSQYLMYSPQKSPEALYTEFFSPPSSSSSYINYNYNNSNINAYSPVSSSSSNIWQEQGQTTLSNPSVNQNLRYRTGPAIQEESDNEIEDLLIHNFNSRYCHE